MIRVTQRQVASGYKALMAIQGRPMETATAYRLFRLKKKLGQEFEFIQEEERKRLTEYGYDVTPEGRILYGEDDEKHQRYIEEMEKVLEMEVDVDAEPADLRGDETLKISLEEMEALEPFLVV